MGQFLEFLKSSGIWQLIVGEDKIFTPSFGADGDLVRIIQYLAMYVIIGALFYLAIVKKFEPLLLFPRPSVSLTTVLTRSSAQ